MIVLGCKNLCKNYGVDVILEDVSFNVNKGERVGIVGENGAGKTTLLNILAGCVKQDSGDILIGKNIKIGYLRQNQKSEYDKSVLEVAEESFVHLKEKDAELEKMQCRLTDAIEDGDESEINRLTQNINDLLEELAEKEFYSYKNKVKSILQNMGFSEEYFYKNVKELSGGEKTRLALACLLLRQPDIMLLDEPTNHLDIMTIGWLENYLAGYKGTIMVISHDRYFLNKITNKTMEISNGKARLYSGGYDFYAMEKAAVREAEMRAFEKREKEISRQKEIIRRLKQHGTEKLAKRAASREKALDKMEVSEAPADERKGMKLKFKQSFQSGRDVVLAENISKSFGYGKTKRELFSNVNLDIKRGEKICIVGDNGIGKTTLLKIIKGDVSQSEGYIKQGHNVKIAYYDQNQELLKDESTVIEELHSAYRLYTQGELKGILAQFLFRGDSVNLPVKSLSGGERARLALLKLMMQGANLLILDEPTNHLDIQSKEVFEKAVTDFEGTVIIISHDRYLLSKIPDKIVELTKEGARIYLGKYDYYEEKRNSIDVNKNLQYGEKNSKNEEMVSASSDYGKVSSKEEREKQKEKERIEKRLQREKETLEEEIQKLEDEIRDIELKLTEEEILKDYEKLAEIGENLNNLRERLQNKYEKWLQYD